MNLTEAVKEAIAQTAPAMSRELRKSARETGWPASVARTLSVEPTDTGFQWTGHDDSMDWEYGTADRPPAPAVRRFMNRTQNAESDLIRNVEAILKRDGVL